MGTAYPCGRKSLFRLSLFVILFSLFCCSFAANRHPQVPLDVRVELKNGRQSDDVARMLAEGIGSVSHKASAGVYHIRLYSNMPLADAITRLEKRPSVARVSALAPKMPGNILREGDVTRIEAIVDGFKQAYSEYKHATGRPDEEEESGEETEEDAALDFLQGYLQHMQIRAYPFKRVDWTGLQSAISERMERLEATDPKMYTPQSIGWEFIGPTNLAVPYRQYYGNGPCNGRVNSICYAPPPTGGANPTIYIGAPLGGVWRTENNGSTWEALSNNWPWQSVGAIAVSPADPNLLLVGTGDYFGFDWPGFGVMRSTNRGATWTQVGSGTSGTGRFSSITFDPDNPNNVIASATNGIFRSTNAGATWTIVASGDYSSVSYGISSGGSRTWYATRPNAPTVWKSTNSGASWTSMTDPIVSPSNRPAIAASKVTAGTLYLLDTTNRKVFKSTTDGASWTDVSAGFPNGSSNYNWSQAWYDYHINTSSNGATDVIYIGLIDIVQSKDGGATWRNMGGSNWTATYTSTAITHNDQHCWAVNPNNPNEMMVGNDGGIYKAVFNSAADTITWTFMSANLGITQFYSIATHPTDPDHIAGGTQDNATPHSRGNLSSWSNPGAGDGAGTVINQSNPLNQYISWQYHGIYRTNNAWSSRSTITPTLTGQSKPFIGRLYLDANNPRYLYINTNFFNRYDSTTSAWTVAISNFNFGSIFEGFEVAPGDSNTLYAGTRNGAMFKSTNWGTNWTQINPAGSGLPNRTITSVSVNPTNKNDIIVGLSGSGAAHLWRCTNTTVAVPIFTSVSGSGATGLPDVSLNTIVRDPDDPQMTWYVGTDIGVFRTTNAGATWTDISLGNGMPPVIVSELSIQKQTGYLTAATYGRGMYRLLVGGNATVSTVTFSPSSVLGGNSSIGTVTLTSQAPFGGAVVSLTSGSGAVTVPATVTVPEGSVSATFTANTTPVGAVTNASVTASYHASQASGNLQVLPEWYYGAPDQVSTLNLTNVTGGVSSVAASDNDYYAGDSTNVSKSSQFYFATQAPTTNPTELKFELEIKAGAQGLPYSIMMFDYVSNSYVKVGGSTTTLNDTLVTLNVPNPGRYISPTNRMEVRIVVSTAIRSTPVWRLSVDWVRWGLKK
ncbi:MAG: hypothetical protein KF784_03200 [Fimbriimonadaceae bacterium]|nr:hypothetical protein [Fimbriimonadaceae bacterium]